ncbi:hypothetical protein CAOG_03305 [Capsaspora owczarzaki ATCC 30864]|uniref:DUF202 domain-containing protein n=1 Tax=Capsaspora owczarzaki (strain ATCC 30864) TaxID=595528 RepID=A0A0D2X2C2_CAPO3|nr:hypothetical protein CAOG_03305 [Capsaspora owczarzaki ATCC 30864]KJE92304.1 hypothetical protein CAOG_003305 [Capsaspora owczarzaki ATCC 30864]|eukprot:XP_004364144.1 hypothetical protein CAOG_03305 [Capsaspora owczarzaki ATCC 30864]
MAKFHRLEEDEQSRSTFGLLGTDGDDPLLLGSAPPASSSSSSSSRNKLPATHASSQPGAAGWSSGDMGAGSAAVELDITSTRAASFASGGPAKLGKKGGKKNKAARQAEGQALGSDDDDDGPAGAGNSTRVDLDVLRQPAALEFMMGKGLDGVADPKTMFANERTFLSWLSLTTSLGAIGTLLITFFDNAGMGLGCAMWAIALVFMLYAVRVFRRRAHALKTCDPSVSFDDPTGPVLLAGSIILAVVVFILYFAIQNPTAMLTL